MTTFTYDGYIEKSQTTPCVWARKNGSKLEYGVKSVPVSAIASMNIRHVEEAPHSLVDAMTLVYNISLGQRTTTPAFQNKFIDRFAKAFFSENYRMSMLVKNDTIINMSSFANYFHMRRWNSEYGVIEPLYDEYRALQGNIVRWLQDAECAANPSYIVDDAIPEERRVEYDERLIANVTGMLADDDDAAAFVEGVFMTCCWRDHSDTDKDLKNAKLREAIDTMKSDYLQVPATSPKQFFSKENIKRLIKIGRSPDHIYYVLEGSDELIDLLAFDPADYGDPEAPGTVRKKKPRKPSKNKAAETDEKWNATLPEAICPEDEKAWKKGARKAGGATRRLVPAMKAGEEADKSGDTGYPVDSVVKVTYMTPEQLEAAQREIREARRSHEAPKEEAPQEPAEGEAEEIPDEPEEEEVVEEEQPKKKRRTRRGGRNNRRKRQGDAG